MVAFVLDRSIHDLSGFLNHHCDRSDRNHVTIIIDLNPSDGVLKRYT